MKRSTLLILIDLLVALIFIALAATGVIIHYTLPAGSGHSATLWGLGRHGWGDLHFWIAITGVALIVLHVALHWGWVCATTPRLVGMKPKALSPARRRACGIATLLVLAGLLGGFTWLASSSITTSPAIATGDGVKSNRIDGVDLRGSMTLTDAAAAIGVSTESLQQQLGLPPEVDPDQRLRDLMRQHGFSMSTVRKIAAAEHTNVVP